MKFDQRDVRIHRVGSELPSSELTRHPDNSSSQENCNEEAGRGEISSTRHRDKSLQISAIAKNLLPGTKSV